MYKRQEYGLFCELRERIASQVLRIQKTAKAVALVDVFASLAFVAERNHYVRPVMNEKGIIEIKGGRHPVVERMIENDMFIPNDTFLEDVYKRQAVCAGRQLGLCAFCQWAGPVFGRQLSVSVQPRSKRFL